MSELSHPETSREPKNPEEKKKFQRAAVDVRDDVRANVWYLPNQEKSQQKRRPFPIPIPIRPGPRSPNEHKNPQGKRKEQRWYVLSSIAKSEKRKHLAKAKLSLQENHDHRFPCPYSSQNIALRDMSNEHRVY